MGDELDRILDAIDDWRERSVPFALATVVGVRGSTYRGLAARQLLGTDGSSVGTVSGGCLDRELHEVAQEVVGSGRPALVEYDLTADDEAIWGWGIGCNGATELLVEPSDSAAQLATRISRARARRRAMAIVHELDSDPPGRRAFVGLDAVDGELADAVVTEAREAIAEGRHRTAVAPAGRYLVEVVGSAPRLVVFGAGHDAAPLVAFGRRLGFEVTVVDDRRHVLTRERFPDAEHLVHADPAELAATVPTDRRTFVVLMSHNYLRDLAALRSLLGTDVAYIGALGPGERLGRLVADARSAGDRVTDVDLARMHGPAGLDVGAEGPDEIAWSIIAEILAVRSGRSGGRLRDRKGRSLGGDVPSTLSTPAPEEEPS